MRAWSRSSLSFVVVAAVACSAPSLAQSSPLPPPAPSTTTAAPMQTSAKPPPPVESRELRVVVAGRPAIVVTPTTLATQTPVSSTQAGGKAKQYAVRALLEKIVGPGARLVAVVDHEGNRAVVDAALLASPDVVAVVWTNRRGLFKVGFVDTKGRRLHESIEFRDVVELQVSAGAVP